MKHLILLLYISTILACSKNDTDVQSFLDCNNFSEAYKSYNGEELECKFYFTLTEFENQNYIELNSRCADLTRFFVYNENCEDICEVEPHSIDSFCGRYIEGRKIIEILLIEK